MTDLDTTSTRDEVEHDIYLALAKHELSHCTDGVMDNLDTVITFAEDDEEDEWHWDEEPTAWVDVDLQRDIKKDDAQ